MIRSRTAVVTGAPGAGKTALIEELARRGYRTVSEAARAILREPGGMKLRTDDPLEFAEAMLARELAELKASSDDGPWTIFDRGIGDSLAFLQLIQFVPSEKMIRRATSLKYSGPIFVAPPWREIFRSDAERIQNWGEAIASGDAVSSVWRELGYQLVELPLASIARRADFVEATLAEI